MAKLLYSVTMSLDGYIAGPGGDMSWLTPHLAPNPLIDEVIDRIGALLVGHNTFRGDDPHRGTDKEGKPFGGGWEGPQFVLTRDQSVSPPPGEVTLMHDLREAVDAARDAAGDRYVNVLGADVARQCLRAGLIDEILTLVAPVLLGGGTPLFSDAGGRQILLRRREVASPRHVTNLWFDVLPAGHATSGR